MNRHFAWSLVLFVVGCEALSPPPENETIFDLPQPDPGAGSQCGSYGGDDFSVHRPFGRVFYAWVSDDEAELMLSQGSPLLPRSEQMTTLLDDLAVQVGLAEASLIPGLGEELAAEFEVKAVLSQQRDLVITTWPRPAFNYPLDRESTSVVRDRLVEIVLKEGAWMAVEGLGAFRVVGSSAEKEELETVLAMPTRLAGVLGHHTRLPRDSSGAAPTTPPPERVSCQGPEGISSVVVGERAFYLNAPEMIESFSIDAPEALRSLHLEEKHLREYLEEMRTFNEPPLSSFELSCYGLRYGALQDSQFPSCVSAYVSALASPDERYRPDVARFVALIDTLDDIDHGKAQYPEHLGLGGAGHDAEQGAEQDEGHTSFGGMGGGAAP